MHSQQIQAEVTRAVLNTLRQDTAFNRKHRPRPGAALAPFILDLRTMTAPGSRPMLGFGTGV